MVSVMMWHRTGAYIWCGSRLQTRLSRAFGLRVKDLKYFACDDALNPGIHIAGFQCVAKVSFTFEHRLEYQCA